MKLLTNKITTITLAALCLVLIPIIIILAGNASTANNKLEPVIAELEHTKGLLEYEVALTEWYNEVQLANHEQTSATIQNLVDKVTVLEQAERDAYKASIGAVNSYTASYDALMNERDYLAGKLAEAITYAQMVRIVEVDKRILVDTDDWVSLAELEGFLDEDDTDEVLVFTANATFNSSCEDRAFQLRHRAFDIGKRLEMEALTPAEYKKWYSDTIASDKLHAICKAIIGNEVWYVEPADDRHWIGAYLD